jgi:hypothetical protein
MGLSPRGDYTPRRVREQRAYRFLMISGTAGLVAVVTFVLALVSSLSFAIPVIAAIVSAVCFFLFRRIVSPS